ncbi:MAG TPA: hypothetical protein VF997_00690 [Polyangia bacterium]
MRIALVLGLTVATAVGCAQSHILRTGTLDRPLVLATGDPEVLVRGIKSGNNWTNVWVDLSVRAIDVAADLSPDDFSLYVPATGMTWPATRRQVFVGGGFTMITAVVIFSGARDGDFRGGTNAPTVRLYAPPGATMPMTVVFETPDKGARDLEQFDIIFRGQRLRLPPPEPKADPRTGMVPVQ